MKKLMFFMTIGLCLMLPLAVQAFTISDPPNDAIGVRTFEGYGINVYNYTPGYNSGGIIVDLFTNYPQAGLTVGSWNTRPADLFITETYYGHQYTWAIPLVNHDGFTANTMYAVGTYNVSDFYEPQPPGGYIYNHGVPVSIATIGNNYGYSSIGSIGVTWDSLVPPGSPDWMIHITSNMYQDDPNGVYRFLWGTATCANDVIEGQIPVPEPGILILLGIALSTVGLASRRFKF